MLNKLKYFASFVAITAGLSIAAAASAEVVLVINDSIKGVSSVSAGDAKKIFLGKSKSLGGGKVKPIALTDGNAARDEFNSNVLGMSNDELKAHWVNESIAGGAKPPKSMKSSSSLAKYVGKKKGAIGYLSAADAAGSGLTIVQIK